MTSYALLAAVAAIAGAASAPAAAQTTAQQAAPAIGAPAVTALPGPAPFIAPRPIQQVVDAQLGTRYAATERQAVARCATAALAQGAILYGVNGYAGTNGYAGYAGAYRPGAAGVPGFPGIATTMKISAITAVQRRWDGMRVKGLIDSGVDYRGASGGQAYQGAGAGGQPYANRHPSNNDLVFRCNLDTAGLVTSIHVERHTTTYRRV
ncbi:MAG: hypothetical protein V4502_01915 [Pseudomonadota bacterium]